MLVLAAGGCDAMSWIPGVDGGHTVTAFEMGSIDDAGLRVTATVKLGKLEHKHNRIMLKSR